LQNRTGRQSLEPKRSKLFCFFSEKIMKAQQSSIILAK
jgi:hypothetical protein